MATQEEKAERNVQEVDDEINNNVEDSDALKVSTRELKGQVLSPDKSSVSIVRIARQARSEQCKNLFQIFRQGANEVLIASMARWGETSENVGCGWRGNACHSGKKLSF